MGKNVRGGESEEGIAEPRCWRATESDIDLVYKLLRKYQVNLKKSDLDVKRDYYLIDDDNLRIAHFSQLDYKYYKLYCVSKAKEARGPKNISFLYEAVAYMFLLTDAIMIDTFICKSNKKSVIAAKANPGWEILEEDDKGLSLRWRIGNCYDTASPARQKALIEKMKRTFDNESRNSIL